MSENNIKIELKTKTNATSQYSKLATKNFNSTTKQTKNFQYKQVPCQ